MEIAHVASRSEAGRRFVPVHPEERARIAQRQEAIRESSQGRARVEAQARPQAGVRPEDHRPQRLEIPHPAISSRAGLTGGAEPRAEGHPRVEGHNRPRSSGAPRTLMPRFGPPSRGIRSRPRPVERPAARQSGTPTLGEGAASRAESPRSRPFETGQGGLKRVVSGPRPRSGRPPTRPRT